MFFDWLKQLMPRGLYGRAALILIVPIVTIQLVVSIVFLQRHFEGVTRQMTESVTLEISFLEAQVDESADLVTAREAVSHVAAALAFEVALPAEGEPVSARAFYDFSGREVGRVLAERFPTLLAVDLSNTRMVALWLDTRHGPMRLAFDRRRVSASNPHQLLVLMVVTGLLMTLIAFIFLRNQLRPIRRLARAAEAFGRGRTLPYKISGATEVRAAGMAFLDMRSRIERQIEQRTLMLSGVSHDLRTPLTRLKLSLSLLDEDAEVAAMKRDVEDMERLLDEFLDFARGDALEGETEEVDPAALVAEVVLRAQRSGQPVEVGAVEGSGNVGMRPHAIARALENLIGNAVRYGSRAVVSVAITERAVRIAVEDDGPGIPKERREEALRPFTRLDAARNQDRGPGVGLGLSIAADIARSHGGTLRLGDSEALGGLRAEIVLAR
ncbi:ATP-binding protein [Ostreiculturibacter nitratireducens]|uniref:ATP-binding protein n=1 Tax=Ostreiculturibacter nitratireducens TaxID=3075226 RepID=UPI0031B56CA9